MSACCRCVASLPDRGRAFLMTVEPALGPQAAIALCDDCRASLIRWLAAGRIELHPAQPIPLHTSPVPLQTK
jgi:hypothetical protein